MGNKPTVLKAEVLQNQIEQYSKGTKKTTGANIVNLWSMDVLQVVMTYSDRVEQLRIIETIFDIPQNKIQVHLNHSQFNPIVDAHLIAPFNKKNNSLSYIQDAVNGQFKLFFTNLIFKGKPENIEYLIKNNKNIIYALMYYITIKKGDILVRGNENEQIEIDSFIESYKQRKIKDMQFDTENVFKSEEDKLNEIQCKNAYKFEEFSREQYQTENINWKLFNDLFLKYIITNQLNFVRDGKKPFDKNINDDINIKELGDLCGISAINTKLTAYNISNVSTNHKTFYGARNSKGLRSKKVRSTTKKISSTFFFGGLRNDDVYSNNNNNDEYVVNVITLRNPLSEEHIKQKGKSLGMKLFDFAVMDDHAFALSFRDT